MPLIAALLLALPGCAPEVTGGLVPPPASTSSDPCASSELGLSIGVGTESFEPIGEGDSLELVHGSQGGWHIVTALELYQAPETVSFSVTGYDAETGTRICQQGDAPLTGWVEPIDTCRGALLNIYCYLLEDLGPLVYGECDTPPELLPGRAITLIAEIGDDAGRSASAEVDAAIAPEQEAQPDCRDESKSDTGEAGF